MDFDGKNELEAEVFARMYKRMHAVQYLLERRPFLRGNDNLLYVYFLHYFHRVGWKVVKSENGGVEDLILEVRTFGSKGKAGIKDLTPLETVSRARRKIQESREDLQPSAQTRLERWQMEQVMRDVMVSL